LSCLFPGCQNDTRSPHNGRQGFICATHWFALALKTRQRWWTETDYGKKPPSRELREDVIKELREKDA
jgi:hypothetical protein